MRSSSDGSLTAAYGNDRSITLYALVSGEQIGDTFVSPDDETFAAALRSDSKELAFGGGAGRQFTVWDLDPAHWVTAACQERHDRAAAALLAAGARDVSLVDWTSFEVMRRRGIELAMAFDEDFVDRRFKPFVDRDT